MDEPLRPPIAAFGPDRRITALAAVGGAVAVAVALLAGDPAGRLLAAVAAVLLLAYVAGDLVFAPRLVASAAGLWIRSPLVRTQLPWAEVEDVRADTRVRHGLRSTTLEIDAGETLVVLTRRALGIDPGHAAALINAFRPA